MDASGASSAIGFHERIIRAGDLRYSHGTTRSHRGSHSDPRSSPPARHIPTLPRSATGIDSRRTARSDFR